METLGDMNQENRLYMRKTATNHLGTLLLASGLIYLLLELNLEKQIPWPKSLQRRLDKP